MNTLRAFFQLALPVLALVLVSLDARAQDTYNFYFQKSGAPESATGVKVIAPANATSTAMPVAPVAVPQMATTAPATPESKDEFRHWMVMLGAAEFADFQRSVEGGGAVMSYDFNRYFGFEISAMAGRDSEAPNSQTTATTWSVGAKVTPLHIQIFGLEVLQVSVIGGVMPAWEVPRGQRWSSDDSQVKIAPYLGGILSIPFGERLLASFEFRSDAGDNSFGSSQTLAGLGYRF